MEGNTLEQNFEENNFEENVSQTTQESVIPETEVMPEESDQNKLLEQKKYYGANTRSKLKKRTAIDIVMLFVHLLLGAGLVGVLYFLRDDLQFVTRIITIVSASVVLACMLWFLADAISQSKLSKRIGRQVRVEISEKQIERIERNLKSRTPLFLYLFGFSILIPTIAAAVVVYLLAPEGFNLLNLLYFVPVVPVFLLFWYAAAHTRRGAFNVFVVERYEDNEVKEYIEMYENGLDKAGNVTIKAYSSAKNQDDEQGDTVDQPTEVVAKQSILFETIEQPAEEVAVESIAEEVVSAEESQPVKKPQPVEQPEKTDFSTWNDLI